MAEQARPKIDSTSLFMALEEAAKTTFSTIAANFERQVCITPQGRIEPSEAFPHSPPGEQGSVHICAKVAFLGEVSGEVILRCNAQGAMDISRGLLMMDEGEALQVSEIEDALAECVNIIGGVMKTKALDPHGAYKLGLPVIFRMPSESKGEHDGALLYQASQGIISVEVWRHTNATDKDRAAA